MPEMPSIPDWMLQHLRKFNFDSLSAQRLGQQYIAAQAEALKKQEGPKKPL